ncbi:unnamed protein product [Porites lobata]|uniref:TRAF-type domain-containing protein n=1 Tax=Porites lobata TaxID=104759 RepID=A0ABN8Q4V3_9CNID|nr:unnamed protein product [Porites lobata]
MRPQVCGYCGVTLPFRQYHDHQELACRKAPVMCPFNCNLVSIPRDQLNGHIASACTRAFVTCPFPVCNDVLRREDLARHEADNAASHLQLLLAERRANQLNEVTPPMTPGRVATFQWNITGFEEQSNSVGRAVGIKSPLFAGQFRAIIVPKMSTAGNTGFFFENAETDPAFLNLSITLRQGSDAFARRSSSPRWLLQSAPLGWEDFLPLDEVRSRYLDENGTLTIQISYQLFT